MQDYKWGKIQKVWTSVVLTHVGGGIQVPLAEQVAINR